MFGREDYARPLSQPLARGPSSTSFSVCVNRTDVPNLNLCARKHVWSKGKKGKEVGGDAE